MKGYTKAGNSYSGYTENQDYCKSATVLSEAYCPSSIGFGKRKDINCSYYGDTCQKGVCTPGPIPTPTPTVPTPSPNVTITPTPTITYTPYPTVTIKPIPTKTYTPFPSPVYTREY